MPVAVLQHVTHLEYAGREQAEKDHHSEADVETPETAADVFFKPRPEWLLHRLAQHKNDKCHAEHAEDAHHSRMPVIGGKVGPRLEIADDRHVDQKAEYAGPGKVPKANRHQEVKRPLMPKRFTSLAARYRDKVRGIESEQGQRDDLER